MRTIRVTGKGQIKVKPDITRITMTLTGVFKEYGGTLRHSSEATEALKDVLSAFGFERSDLKTLSFHADTEYEGYRDKNNDYKRRFVGYRFNHVLKVEFESDNDRLGKILYALANGKVRPEFRISYTVKDPEAAKNLLLGKAVTDAKKKAARLKRYQAIAESAAKQSKRMQIPTVHMPVTFQQALAMIAESDVRLMPYENAEGMEGTRRILESIEPGESIAILIGPEGGIDEAEVEMAMKEKVEPITLGKRILRTETAGMTVLSILVYLLEGRERTR